MKVGNGLLEKRASSVNLRRACYGKVLPGLFICSEDFFVPNVSDGTRVRDVGV